YQWVTVITIRVNRHGSRTVRPCPRARRHTASRRAATGSSGGGASGDSDGSGGDGSASPPPLESYRPPHLAVLLDLLQRSPMQPAPTFNILRPAGERTPSTATLASPSGAVTIAPVESFG